MAWVNGYPKSKVPLINWNKKFLTELEGELEEEVARKTLGKFLMHNIGFLFTILTGKHLTSYQRIMLKGWFNRNFTLCVAGRGVGKSFLVIPFAILYCLFNPGHSILLVSATFRSSRRILEDLEKLSEGKDGALLKQTFAKKMGRKQDIMQLDFANGSRIVAVPLGDPNNLRGFRCNVLILDEALLIPQQVIDLVLKPFLTKPADEDMQRKIRRYEDKMIAKGKMIEEEREVFKPKSKMILLSSASYQWENLYTIYKDYLKTIYDIEEKGVKEDDATYLVQQLSYEIADQRLMDKAVLDDIKNGSTPQSVIDREYKAIFTQGSDGYFSSKKMAEVTIQDGMEPCIELRGEKGAEYVLGIDPNVSASDTSDHFAMCVLKIITKTNGKKIGLVVHNYAACGCPLKYHIMYFIYLLKFFNIVYIVEDASQGSNADFINICNESELFKQERLNLLPVNADFGKDDINDIAKQIKRFYKKGSNEIVQKQYFHSSFIRASNEHLQSCFNFNNIYFAGKARAVPNVNERLAEGNIGDIYRIHPEFSDKEGDGNIHDFIAYQDIMIDTLKRECSNIEMKASVLGNISFDLPSSMKRNKNPGRERKDSYSALLLANWGLKLLIMSQEIKEEDEEEAVPLMFNLPSRS